jgi:hypothetical protein
VSGRITPSHDRARFGPWRRPWPGRWLRNHAAWAWTRTEDGFSLDDDERTVSFSAVSDPKRWGPEPGTGFVVLADEVVDSERWLAAQFRTTAAGPPVVIGSWQGIELIGFENFPE